MFSITFTAVSDLPQIRVRIFLFLQEPGGRRELGDPAWLLGLQWDTVPGMGRGVAVLGTALGEMWGMGWDGMGWERGPALPPNPPGAPALVVILSNFPDTKPRFSTAEVPSVIKH